MKKQAMFLIVILALSSITFAANVPSVLVESIYPQPAEPGEDLELDVTFFNRESSSTNTFSIALEYDYPFIFKSATENITNRDLCSNCGISSKYFFLIDPSAVSGTYPLFIKVFSGSSQEVKQVDITVKGSPSVVFKTNLEDLNQVIPDSQFEVRMNVSNVGSGEARQIKISTDSSNFITLGNSIYTIDKLKPNETQEASFEFLAASDLKATSYTIPFNIKYKDDQGNEISTSQNVGVRVVNKANIDIQTIKVVSSKGSSQIKQNEQFTVIARLENTGKGDANSVSANITCPFSDNKKAFIGKLKKDEDAPVVFDLVSYQGGSFACGLTINYEDDLGSYNVEETFPISISSNDYIVPTVAFLVILGISLIAFRKKIPYIKNM